MTIPHLMNCPHKGGTWCLKCVGEEWDRREAERDALNARIAELERKAKAFDAIERGLCSYMGRVWIITGGDDVRIESPDISDPDSIEEFSLLTAIEAAIAAKESK